ncbi:autotransporter domain-containing protein [Asticcacaulis tiandongensis]|uniref:autotransporter domain-containing protein n=1 Tax=Asticcacaulis tiandongensis TaxID=2565365 RepID=UPI001126CEF7|nr:autotransporter domain-containing protein [Asticcacaulis tiandongensis]
MTHPTFSRRTGRKAALYLGSALLTLAAQSPVLAQTVTWQGGTSSDWQDGSNWSNGHVPANNTVVIAPSGGASNPVVDGGTAATGTIWLGSVDGANLTFQNGAQAESGTVTIGNRTNNGAVAGIHQETGIATATGIGTVWNTDSVTVGYYGKGTLNVSGGAVVSSANGLTIASMALNADATNTGTVSVSGAGSKLVTTQGMSVGADGKGDLNVSGGGRVESRSGSIGTNSGSNGTATFTGDDSFWNIVGSNLTVGQSGQGSLTISDGAGVQTSHRVSIGNSNGSTGKLTVTGAGSTLTSLATGSGDYIGIGINGTGELEVLDGAEATGIRTILGYTSGRSGTLKLDGTNSLFHLTDYAMIGMSGTGKATVSNGATLRADGVGGVLLGYGATGNGTLNIGAAAGDAATGAGTITAPKIQFGAGTGELVLNHNTANYELTTPLVGAGTISVLAGDTTLSGDSTLFTGTTTIDGGIIRVTGTLGGATTVNNAGALYVGNGTKSGTLTGNIVNNGAVIFNPSGDSSYSGMLSGTGSLSHIGTGTTRLTGNNSLYTGTASVTGGTLELAHLFGGAVTTGNGGTLKLSDGSFYNGSIINNGATVFNRTSHYNYTGSLSGSGEITKQQSGILTLTGNSSAFTGTTTVAEGAVLLTGALGGSVAINSGAMFQAGNNSHSIGFNGNVLNNGAFLLNNSHGNYQHSFAGNISGNGTNTIHTTLGRTLILSGNSGAFTGTTYFTGGGTYLTGALGGAVVINADAGLAVGNGTVGGELLATDVTNNGLLYFWQPGQTTYAGSLSGNGTIGQAGNGKTILAGNSSAFTGTTMVQTGSIELTGTLGGSVFVSNGSSFIFNHSGDYVHLGALTGAGNLYKEGDNKLILSADNSGFTGLTTVGAGTLQLMNALGGHIAINSGGELSLLRSGDYSLTGGISGAGSFRKGQSGILTLSGSTNFSGTTYVDGGILRLDSGLSGNALISSKGTLELANGAYDGNIVNNGMLILSRGDTLSTSHSGQISGGGAIIKRTAGNVALTGDNNGFNGNITVEAGALTVGNVLGGAATVQSGATFGINNNAVFNGNILNDGTVIVSRTTDYAYGGVLSGSGELIKQRGGTLTLSGDNSGFSGTTSVTGGTLLLTNALGGNASVSNGATLRLGSQFGGNIVNNGTLSFEQSGDNTYAGKLSGTGVITKATTGLLTYAGNGSGFTGTTHLDAGTLLLTGSLAGTVHINANGALRVGNGTTDGELLANAVNNGVLIFDQTGDYDYTGALSGNGGLVKRGNGTLLLSGNYSYTGTTQVEGGLVRLTSQLDTETDLKIDNGTFDLSNRTQEVSGLSGNSGTLALGSTGNLVVQQNENSTFGGSLSGGGTFTKAGEGNLNLTGNSTFTGEVNVNEGRLALNGTLPGQVNVNSGGALGGTGTAGQVTVRSGGTLAPGNSIGTLRVNGSVLFEAGSVYSVEVDAAGQSDRIDATGQARLQGGMVEVLAEEGNYRPQTDYTILTAVAGVQGTFTDVSSNFAYLTPRLIYSADRVVLSLSRNDVELGDIARTPNQIATAGAVTSAFSGISDLYINMVGLSEDGARTAFDNLSGEVHPSSLSAAANHSESLRRALTDRLDVSVEDGALMWIEAIGERGELEATSNTARVSGHNAGGVRLGIDTQREGVRFGVAAGFTDSSLNVHNRSSYADVKTAHIAAYAGARAGAVNLRGGISYSDLDFKTRRHVRIGDLSQQLTASYGGKATQLFGEAGYDLNLGGTTVEPFIGLNALWLNNDGFSENGGDLALTAREQTRERTWSTLGVKTQYSFGEVSPVTVNLKAGWQHALGKQSVASDLAFANGQNFAVQGAPLAKDSALIDISLNWTLSPSANLGVGYTGTFADQGESQALKIVVGARF